MFSVTILHTDTENSVLISITFETTILEVFRMITLQKMVVQGVTPLRFLDR
jgi:hypothetical protein